MSLLDHVLVPLDGSPLSERVLQTLERLRGDDGGRISLLRVVAAPEAKAAAEGHLEEVRARLAKSGWAVSAEVRVAEDAGAAILAAVEEGRPTLVGMTSHGRSGVARLIRGSVAERVLRHAPAPLLMTTPLTVDHPFRRVLVPLDGSERSAGVLPLATEVAKRSGARLELLSSSWVAPLESPVAYQRELDRERERLDAATSREEARLKEAGLTVERSVTVGHPAAAILDAAGDEADLVALTTHGRTGFDRWLLGSIAESVLRACRRPVLVLRTASAAAEA